MIIYYEIYQNNLLPSASLLRPSFAQLSAPGGAEAKPCKTQNRSQQYLAISDGRFTASVRNAAGKIVWLERFKYPFDSLTFIPTQFSSGEFSALLRPTHEILWDGKDNSGYRVPNGIHSFWIHGMIKLMDGTPIIANPKQKDIVKSVNFFKIFYCPTTSRKRYPEAELLKKGGLHSPTWNRGTIKQRALTSPQLPQGQFGSETEVRAVVAAYAPFVCPGATEFFEAAGMEESKVFHPAIPDFINNPLPATHIFIQVKKKKNDEGAYEVHAYPALSPKKVKYGE